MQTVEEFYIVVRFEFQPTLAEIYQYGTQNYFKEIQHSVLVQTQKNITVEQVKTRKTRLEIATTFGEIVFAHHYDQLYHIVWSADDAVIEKLRSTKTVRDYFIELKNRQQPNNSNAFGCVIEIHDIDPWLNN